MSDIYIRPECPFHYCESPARCAPTGGCKHRPPDNPQSISIGKPAVMTFEDMTEPEIARHMTAAARAVRAALPEGSLFVILAFNDPAVAQYISNAERSGMIRSLREAADRIEARENVPR